jgi:hypothetical protein
LLIEGVKILRRIPQNLFQAVLGDRNAGEVGDDLDPIRRRVLHGRLDPTPLQLVGELNAPREPHPVRLQLTIQSGERYRSYRVVIRDGDQNQVWSGTLDGDLTANLRVLVVPLPSEVFRPGDYALELSGDPGTGEFAGLEDYAFSVVRK